MPFLVEKVEIKDTLLPKKDRYKANLVVSEYFGLFLKSLCIVMQDKTLENRFR